MWNDIWQDSNQDLFFYNDLRNKLDTQSDIDRKEFIQWFDKKSSQSSKKHKGQTYKKLGNITLTPILQNYKELVRKSNALNRFGIHSVDYWDTHEFTKELISIFNIDVLTMCRVNCCLPKGITSNHLDYEIHALRHYRDKIKDIKFKDIGHCLIFLEDQRMGEYFQFGGKSVSWKAGDCFTFPWYMRHGGHNQGQYPIYATHITTFNVKV